MLAAWRKGDLPSSLYLEGPDEALKAELLATLKDAWARAAARAGESAGVRVFQAAESDPEAALSAYQTVSLFATRELVVVLDVEDWARSEKRIAAVAAALRAPGGGACLVLVESAADSPRKSLEPLRAAAALRVIADPPGVAELRALAQRRMEAAGVRLEAEALDLLVEVSQGETASFFNELDKVCVWAAEKGTASAAECRLLLRPVVGADLADYLSAVALGRSGPARQRLLRLLATGVGEGSVLFALSNLYGGALGGWARYRSLSDELRRRLPARRLAEGLDLIYRMDRAWKSGHAPADALLEHATQALCAPGATGGR